jgi:hypothetical protein
LRLFHIALPWLPLAVGGAYLAVLAGAVLLGMAYTGALRVLPWVRGVGQIVQQAKPV